MKESKNDIREEISALPWNKIYSEEEGCWAIYTGEYFLIAQVPGPKDEAEGDACLIQDALKNALRVEELAKVLKQLVESCENPYLSPDAWERSSEYLEAKKILVGEGWK